MEPCIQVSIPDFDFSNKDSTYLTDTKGGLLFVHRLTPLVAIAAEREDANGMAVWMSGMSDEEWVEIIQQKSIGWYVHHQNLSVKIPVSERGEVLGIGETTDFIRKKFHEHFGTEDDWAIDKKLMARGLAVTCPRCGGSGSMESLDEEEMFRGIRDVCYHCQELGKTAPQWTLDLLERLKTDHLYAEIVGDPEPETPPF